MEKAASFCATPLFHDFVHVSYLPQMQDQKRSWKGRHSTALLNPQRNQNTIGDARVGADPGTIRQVGIASSESALQLHQPSLSSGVSNSDLRTILGNYKKERSISCVPARWRKNMLGSIIKVCVRSVGLCTLGAAVLVLTACAALDTKTSTVPPADAPVRDAFAAEVAMMAEGTAVTLNSPLGADSLVSVGTLYTSALGQQCRPVYVTVSGNVHRLSVCQDESGWHTVDSIFEAMPR